MDRYLGMSSVRHAREGTDGVLDRTRTLFQTLIPMNRASRNLVVAVAAGSLFLNSHRARAADRDRVEDADFPKTVTIVFSGTTATITNGAGVTVSQGTSTSAISITSTVEGVKYLLSGTSADGYVQITSTYPSKVSLNGVSLASTNGPALSMLSAARNFIVMEDGTSNSLTDSAAYTRSGSGTLYGTGPLIFSGKGSLTVAGLKSHAIYGGTYVRCLGGDVKVSSAVKDAIHSKTLFQMDQGALSLSATGDGIDGDSGQVVINGGSISIRSTVDDTKGIVCDGAVAINGGAIDMTVSGVQSKGLSSKGNITVAGGSLAFNMSGAVNLASVTSNGVTYVDPSYCTAMKCDGNLTVSGGSISMTHTGLAGKGITTDGNILISGGKLDLFTSGGTSASYTGESGATDTASADCLKADGTLTVTAGTILAASIGAGGDCLSSDLALNVSGGTLSLLTAGASGDCLGSDAALGISGGTLDLTVKGAQSKGFKSGTDMSITGGTMTFAMSGAVVLELVTTGKYNPSYCSAMKCDGNFTASNGSVTITHSGQAGKGISVDGNVTITGGTMNISTSGAATAIFTNATTNASDIAAADCLKSDGNMTINGGTVTAASTGTGADAISCDGVALIGTLGVSATPVITASTSGAKVLLSGSGMNADYVNAKAFKAGGNLTMNGGIYRATTSTDGGEGMESKATLTINGGLIEITSYDDAINATTKVAVTGGTIYCYSTNNDGIDSNGTFQFTGGTIVSSGFTAPEEGFDCDQNNFAITGGTLIGTGGATSTPTAASSTQRTVICKTSGTLNQYLVLRQTSNSGNVIVYKLPRTYTGTSGMTVLLSSSSIAAGTGYTLLGNATVTGGTDFHGYVTGATVSGGTTLKTFTTSSSSTVTTVN